VIGYWHDTVVCVHLPMLCIVAKCTAKVSEQVMLQISLLYPIKLPTSKFRHFGF